jgi:hypothetical protein
MFEERCGVNISNPSGNEIMLKPTEKEMMFLALCWDSSRSRYENHTTATVMTWLEYDFELNMLKFAPNQMMFFVLSPGHETHGAQ